VTPFWLWVAAGCVAAALCGFSAVRVGARALARQSDPEARPRERPPAARVEPSPAAREPLPEPAAPVPGVVPTTPAPDADRLELWARQVRAGERRMSVATDGCRVTWHRVCKHGHPSWLAYLGYVDDVPVPPPVARAPRKTPRAAS
jgi:hypothetical protein